MYTVSHLINENGTLLFLYPQIHWVKIVKYSQSIIWKCESQMINWLFSVIPSLCLTTRRHCDVCQFPSCHCMVSFIVWKKQTLKQSTCCSCQICQILHSLSVNGVTITSLAMSLSVLKALPWHRGLHRSAWLLLIWRVASNIYCNWIGWGLIVSP